MVEVFSFGTLSKFYKNLKNPDKKDIAKSFGLGYTYFESWLESISYVRNICAHYGRLYNAKFSKTPQLYKEYNKVGIGNNRLFGVLLCLKHLLINDSHWNSFVELFGYIVGAATIIVGLTKSVKDDEFLAKLKKVLVYFSLFNEDGTMHKEDK